MNMKRKIVLLSVLLALALPLASCGNGKVADTDGIIGNEEAERLEEGADKVKDEAKDMVDKVVSGSALFRREV